MLKRLRSQLFMSQVQKQLERTKVNKTHEFIQPKHIIITSNLINVPKMKNQLLNNLYKKIHSSETTLKIKAFIILHACLRKSFDDDLCQLIMKEDVQEGIASPTAKDQKAHLDAYMGKNVVDFYILYLKKVCMNKESFIYIKKFAKKDTYQTETYESTELKHEQNIEIVTHGFKILNLCNYILQSQEMFNKMGRYHIEYEQILSMYMQFLQDLNIFNTYIKLSVRIILQRYNESKNSIQESAKFLRLCSQIKPSYIGLDKMKKDKSLTSTTKAQTVKILEEETDTKHNQQQIQEIKHYFLYINESQKLSDRLYEYYHNRYYYKVLRNLIVFPTFLTIENKDYSRIKKQTKKIDRNLVLLVSKSKYLDSSVLGSSIKTQPNIPAKQRMNTTYDGYNFTEAAQQTDDLYRNITHHFIKEKIEEVVHDVQDYY